MDRRLLAQIAAEAAIIRETFPEKIWNLALIVPGALALYLPAELRERGSGLIEERMRSNFKSDSLAMLDGMLIDQKWIWIMGLQSSANRRTLCRGWTQEMQLLYAFDHEMGHLVVRNGNLATIDFAFRHLSECAADAFASLRHLQRYGSATGLPSLSRAFTIVDGVSPIHYTDKVINRVQEIAAVRDVSKLDLRQTAELAADIAWACRTPGKELLRLTEIFAPVARAYACFRKENSIVYRTAAWVAMENKGDSAVMKAVKDYFNSRSWLDKAARRHKEWRKVAHMLNAVR